MVARILLILFPHVAAFAPSGKSELQTAVNAWTSNPAVAELNYGHISTWDTSQVTYVSWGVRLCRTCRFGKGLRRGGCTRNRLRGFVSWGLVNLSSSLLVLGGSEFGGFSWCLAPPDLRLHMRLLVEVWRCFGAMWC